MTKKQLIDDLHAVYPGMKKSALDDLLDTLGRMVGESLELDGEITLPRIGKFSVVERAARTGRNPRTGEAIEIPARRVVRFKPAKFLREAVEEMQ